MTTPPPPQPPPPPPPQPDDGLEDAALAVAVASVLVTAVSAAAAVAALKPRFALSRDTWTVLTAVLTDVMQSPPPVTGVIGAASAQTSRMNTARRAQYVLAASRRVLAAARDARSKGEPVTAAVRKQLAMERRFYAQHQQAMWNRATAAGKTDMAAVEHGPLLGWNTVLDARTSAECRAADRKNYYATRIPYIGLPGSVHPHCRCFPGPPHPGAPLLPARGSRFARAA